MSTQHRLQRSPVAKHPTSLMHPLFRLLTTLICGMVLPVLSVQAAFPGANGTIAFTHYISWPVMEIWRVNPDGSGQQLIIPNEGTDKAEPTWSPDGKKIAFHAGFPHREIYIANADGSNVLQITNNAYENIEPSWSPDGTKLVFSSNRSGEGGYDIYIMNVTGTNLVRLTTHHFVIEARPVWSPNGTKIAFASERDGNQEIYMMNADGSNQTRLTNNSAADWVPDWSPDGSKITFVSDRNGNSEIYVMNADGSNPVNLTNNSASDITPAWSPDGKKIAFARNETIWVMNSDGSMQTQLTTIHGLFHDWQPIPTTVNSTPLLSLNDINKDGAPEIAVIAYNSALKKSTATVKNAKTGSLVKQITFNGQFVPSKANVLPDLNGNGASEIAVLGIRSSDQAVQVEVRDSLSGVKLSAMPFDPAFKPLDLGVVRDISGKGTAGLAVLQQNATQLRVQLKNALTGAQIRNISFNANYNGIDLLVISDLNANQSREIAVLADNKTVTAADIVEIRDSKTGDLIRTISYGSGQELKQLINLPDLNNNGGAELAVLRANTARVSLKDAKTGLALNTLDYALSQPFKLASVGDSSSQTHLAMLGLRASDGQPRAEVHDALSDTLINKVVFDNYGTTVGFISIPDINGNGVAELVRLREQPGPQKLFAEVRDGRTGVLIQGMYF